MRPPRAIAELAESVPRELAHDIARRLGAALWIVGRRRWLVARRRAGATVEPPRRD